MLKIVFIFFLFAHSSSTEELSTGFMSVLMRHREEICTLCPENGHEIYFLKDNFEKEFESVFNEKFSLDVLNKQSVLRVLTKEELFASGARSYFEVHFSRANGKIRAEFSKVCLVFDNKYQKSGFVLVCDQEDWERSEFIWSK